MLLPLLIMCQDIASGDTVSAIFVPLVVRSSTLATVSVTTHANQDFVNELHEIFWGMEIAFSEPMFRA